MPRTLSKKFTMEFDLSTQDGETAWSAIIAWMIRQPPPVLTKKDFVTRYSAGEFGNASPTWNTCLEWLNAHPNYVGLTTDLFHIRNRIAGGKTWYNVPWVAIVPTWITATEEVGAGNLYISAMAPTERTILQGEVQQGTNGLELFYSTVAKPMREALREQAEQVYGITAVALLRRYLCPNSYEWLQVLLDRYPFHVVEFSTYSCNWGTLPGYNTVFWEVRRY